VAIKTNGKQRGLVFGDFIVAAYEAWGRRKARWLVRLAVNAQLVEFHGGQLFVITEN
jgi:hypothetical protein